MENCVDIKDFNSSNLVIIKQPGSVRHTVTEEAIIKIEMSVQEAVELYRQLGAKLRGVSPGTAHIIDQTRYV